MCQKLVSVLRLLLLTGNRRSSFPPHGRMVQEFRSPLKHRSPGFANQPVSLSPCLFLQDTSQPWYGRIQRRWEWGRRLQVTGPLLSWPDTSQQGMSSTRASLRKMSCLQRSNICPVEWEGGRLKNLDMKCLEQQNSAVCLSLWVCVPVSVMLSLLHTHSVRQLCVKSFSSKK